jgi:hypothetical protein
MLLIAQLLASYLRLNGEPKGFYGAHTVLRH